MLRLRRVANPAKAVNVDRLVIGVVEAGDGQRITSTSIPPSTAPNWTAKS